MEASSLAKRPRLEPALEGDQQRAAEEPRADEDQLRDADSGERSEEGGRGDEGERGEGGRGAEGERSEGGEAEEEEEGDERVQEQMNEFFSELDMDFARQKRNLLTEGLRVGLATHLGAIIDPLCCAGAATQELATHSPALGDGQCESETG